MYFITVNNQEYSYMLFTNVYDAVRNYYESILFQSFKDAGIKPKIKFSDLDKLLS